MTSRTTTNTKNQTGADGHGAVILMLGSQQRERLSSFDAEELVEHEVIPTFRRALEELVRFGLAEGIPDFRLGDMLIELGRMTYSDDDRITCDIRMAVATLYHGGAALGMSKREIGANFSIGMYDGTRRGSDKE